MGHESGVFTGDLVGAAYRGARWRDLPEEYPDGSTCWRRLRMWEEQGVWLRPWRKLLGQMDERKLLDWDEAILDATFVTAKKGPRGRQDPKCPSDYPGA
jgi:transposase